MNKKLFGTLLLGSLLMGGTFVSCKDYDDDIENLQGQISGVESQVTDVKALVAQLQSKLDGMTYVQSVTKSSDGKTIKFTMSNGQTVEFTDTVSDPGSVVTVEDGVLCIDGKPTEIKVASAINMPKVENGQIYIYDEEAGEYAATGIFVNQNTVVESATKYTITMTTSDGTTATFDVPKASGLITEIKVAPYTTDKTVLAPAPAPGSAHTHAADNISDFEVAQYDVTASDMANWKGPKPELKNGNIVFGFGTLNVRVNPVKVDLEGIEFSLVNTKNEPLPTIALKASAESGDNPIVIGSINTRANDGNGLWTLSCENMVIAQTDWWSTLDTKIGKNVAFAVTAGGDVRSSYNVDVIKVQAPALNQVYFWKGVTNPAGEMATVVAAGNPIVAANTTLEVNKAYKLVAKEEEKMALYDVYMTVSDLAKETYGIVIDNEARTVKYTKQPDVVSTDLSFDVNIKTADNYGKVKDGKITVNLSSKINAESQFEAQTYDLTKLTDNNKFAVALDPMKNALGAAGYNRWANNVSLTNSKNVQFFTDASCTRAATTVNSATAPTIDFVDADGNTANVNTLKSVRFTVLPANSDLKIGKQYYAKVTFKNGATPSTEINSIVIPVKFTAPSVSEQFKPKAGYVVDGVINAYFYKANEISVDLERYFDAADKFATLEMKGDDNIVTKDANTKWSSNVLAYFASTVVAPLANKVQSALVPADKTTRLTSGKKYLVLTSDKVDPANDPTEAGYGKTLTVKVFNPCYTSTNWSYEADADKQHSFKINIMSPIFEGTIKPAEGASVKLVANNVAGSNITSEMIVATDYTGTNKIEIMPDKAGATPTALVWSNPQIKKVDVDKDTPTNTYISDVAINPYVAATANTPAVLGSINVKADPVSNDVDTKIKVMVEDAWGYVNTVMLPVTITKQ